MSITIDLAGKIALITGSSRGLGLTFARGLARAGAHVVVNGRKEKTVAAAVEALTGEGLSASGSVFDITDEAATRDAVERIVRDRERIDILVNNAGRQIRAPLHEFDLNDWNEVLNINLTGAFLTAKAVVPQMMARKSGKIVNICSL